MAFWKPFAKSAAAAKYGDEAADEILDLVSKILKPPRSGKVDLASAVRALSAADDVGSLLDCGALPLPGRRILITDKRILSDPGFQAALAKTGPWRLIEPK
jgi:hypothetical protein